MQSWDRIGSWMEFMKDCWKKESPAVRDEIIRQADEENATLFKEWKQTAAFAGTSENLNMYYNLQSITWSILTHVFRAWRMSENVLPTFADAMAEWQGANIIILAVALLGSSDGEVVICS